MASEKVHMVQQIIKYSDGTETVINYRGVIENGELMPDEPEEKELEVPSESAPVEESAPAEAASEAPASEPAAE